MIALDTNVLLRHLTSDDEEQARVADDFVETYLSPTQPGFVSIAVFLETLWVLRQGHGYSSGQVEAVAHALISASRFVVANAELIERALRQDGSVGLADRVIHELGKAAGCAETVTFDRRFARLPGVRLLGA